MKFNRIEFPGIAHTVYCTVRPPGGRPLGVWIFQKMKGLRVTKAIEPHDNLRSLYDPSRAGAGHLSVLTPGGVTHQEVCRDIRR